MDNQFLSFLGLMKKAGDLECGSEPAYDAARNHMARLILITEDAAGNTRAQAKNIASQFHLPVVTLPTDKTALGVALGMRTCAVAAVTNTGFALSLAQKLGLEEETALLQEKQDREKRRKQKKIDRTAAKQAAPQNGEKKQPVQSEKKPFERGDKKPAQYGDRPFSRGGANGDKKPFERGDKKPAQYGDRPFSRGGANGEKKPFERGDKKPAQYGDRPFSRGGANGDKKPFERGGKPQGRKFSQAPSKRPQAGRGTNQPRNKGGN